MVLFILRRPERQGQERVLAKPTWRPRNYRNYWHYNSTRKPEPQWQRHHRYVGQNALCNAERAARSLLHGGDEVTEAKLYDGGHVVRHWRWDPATRQVVRVVSHEEADVSSLCDA